MTRRHYSRYIYKEVCTSIGKTNLPIDPMYIEHMYSILLSDWPRTYVQHDIIYE